MFLCGASAHQRGLMAHLLKDKLALEPFISDCCHGLRPNPERDRPWLGELEPSGHQ